MKQGVKLTKEERLTLGQVLERLQKEGVCISDESLLTALLRAAAALPEEKLIELIKSGLAAQNEERQGNPS